ncbi:Uu.00g092370.m01.CDS01 [Anthostomella pinea]|uniref:Uu.00g092370.m01.CDS01 n=1 Tax=Anthostomella pinea TaxID=933095 RepID=A0AAI8VP80_9PEZI|nr:Uu.00g092370.m01.CDS01 [Anthostomella pinea]
MASTTVHEKGSKPGRPTLYTEQTHTPGISPKNEKNPEISMEIRRNSSASSPCSITNTNGFDTDIEAMMPARSCDNLNKSTTSGTRTTKPDCTVWPGQAHWKQKTRAAKINNSRSCQCLSQLSKRTRIMVKIAIALLIIGIAVGVGFGISKPLGASIWKPNN